MTDTPFVVFVCIPGYVLSPEVLIGLRCNKPSVLTVSFPSITFVVTLFETKNSIFRVGKLLKSSQAIVNSTFPMALNKFPLKSRYSLFSFSSNLVCLILNSSSRKLLLIQLGFVPVSSIALASITELFMPHTLIGLSAKSYSLFSDTCQQVFFLGILTSSESPRSPSSSSCLAMFVSSKYATSFSLCD